MDTPVELNVKLSIEEGDLSDLTTYRQLVGSLIYLTITRPDISYAVSPMNQFMTAPRHLHLAAVRRIIRYLIRTPTRGLFFFHPTTLYLSKHISMLIGLVVRILADRRLAGACF